ncbi:protein-tyrosine phosphatase [Mycolicibacterium fluoranthenivorans]|uniref:Protein-tyrosine phosphatase n=2 Tax=Mycolicibacterium fluoranthenivorans TaxID=258505 RepID=A0A1G4V7A0_9MYCO|nr:protein-tyrosine phosphatase [Mycolicibacterium fluoranthenivorans]
MPTSVRVRYILVAAIATAGPLWGSIAQPTATLGAVAVAVAEPSRPSDMPAPTPRLASVDNFRDVAGPDAGYPTASGTHMRRGVIYRSSALRPDVTDAQVLDGLHLTHDYDLRTTAEIADSPDIVPPGTTYVHLNIIGDQNPIPTMADLSPDSARQLLIDQNKVFVDDAGERERFGELLRSLATNPDPQVFHCTSGKDRTGWTAAVLQTLAGVSPDDVMNDYLLTNEYSRQSIDAGAEAATQAYGAEAGAGTRVILGVFPEALQAGLDQVRARYGTMERYVAEGLDLDPATIAALKKKLTV